MCNRVLLLFGKFQQWNFHVKGTFQSSLIFQTGLGSLRVSCKDLGSKGLNIRIFYKFLLYIKPRYICCHLQKKINKPPPLGGLTGAPKFHMLKSCKKHGLLFDWMAPWKFLILIIWFSEDETGQVCGALFMVEFGQILPLSSIHHGFFLLISSEICWVIELIINIYNLCYHIVVLKKTSVLKKTLLGPYLGKTWASMGHTQNETQLFFWK